MKCMHRYIIIFLMVILVIKSITLQASGVMDTEEATQEYVPGQVMCIDSEEMDEEDHMKYQNISVKILEGKYINEIVSVFHTTNLVSVYKYTIKPGDKVLLSVRYDEQEKKLQAHIRDHLRYKYLLYIIGAFLGILVLLGGMQGIKTIITLGLTLFCIVQFYIPLILKGYNPIWLSIIICSLLIIICFFIIAGFNNKSYTAIMGTISGIAIAGVIAYYFGEVIHLTGISGQQVELLSYTKEGSFLNFKGILMGSIIMGSLGAIMDVSMSISSAMYEIEQANPKITTTSLILSGMNVGKDMMATMSNTLVLAYIGSSIHLVLVFLVYQKPFIPFVNTDEVAAEVVRAMAGSIGLILTIPITAIIKGIFRENFSCASKYARRNKYK